MAGAPTAGQIHRVEGLQRLDVPRGCAESDEKQLDVEFEQLWVSAGRGIKQAPVTDGQKTSS